MSHKRNKQNNRKSKRHNRRFRYLSMHSLRLYNQQGDQEHAARKIGQPSSRRDALQFHLKKNLLPKRLHDLLCYMVRKRNGDQTYHLVEAFCDILTTLKPESDAGVEARRVASEAGIPEERIKRREDLVTWLQEGKPVATNQETQPSISPPNLQPDALPSASIAPSSLPQSPSSTKRLDVYPDSSLARFWIKVIPLKFGMLNPLADRDQEAVRTHVSQRDKWDLLSLAVLALHAWETIGETNTPNVDAYKQCQRSNNLEYLLNNHSSIAKECGLAALNDEPFKSRMEQLLRGLDNLTHDQKASDAIVKECFPRSWANFLKSHKPLPT